MSKQPPLLSTASTVDPCPTVIQMGRMPGTESYPKPSPVPDHPDPSSVISTVLKPVLQITRGIKDNLGMIFHITPLKHVATHHQNRLTEGVLMRGHNICFH